MPEIVIQPFSEEQVGPSSYWLILTATDEDSNVIGFIDTKVVPLKKLAKIEAPMDLKSQIRRDAWEDGFYVVPSHRNKGVGSNLFEALIQRLKEEGIEHLLVFQPTPESVEFYKKHGGQGEALMSMYFDLRGTK